MNKLKLKLLLGTILLYLLMCIGLNTLKGRWVFFNGGKGDTITGKLYNYKHSDFINTKQGRYKWVELK